jgi:hypothetical protein
VTKIK